MANIFTSVKLRKPKRNKFNLNHENLLTTDFGLLTPIFCQEVVPGDTFKMSTEILVKMLALRAPIMGRVDVYTHFFFVPYRLIWDDFKEFITGGENGTSTPPYPLFKMPSDASFNTSMALRLNAGSLADYLGFPIYRSGNFPGGQRPNADGNLTPRYSAGIGPGDVVSKLPFNAYNLIWNEYYRDQNLQEPIELHTNSNEELVTDFGYFDLKYRAWRKDYFTSALPFVQRGPEVTLGGGSTINNPLFVTENYDMNLSGNTNNRITASFGYKNNTSQTGTGNEFLLQVGNNTTTNNIPQSVTKIVGDAAAEGGFTMNELRRSMRVQEWLEKNARGGARYIEQILSHFGVRSSDSRLQRPEYLGGGVQPVVISELLQTSESTSNSPQGTQTGNGVSLGRTNQFKCFFEEHGLVMGIMSIVPNAIYHQGVPRQWLRRDKFDFLWPEFAHLGEQPIYNEELMHLNDTLETEAPMNKGVWGYTPRYAEYRYIPSSVHGDFLSTLDYWTLARTFNGNLGDGTTIPKVPGLNGDFISVKPSDADNIFPVQSGNNPNPGRLYVQTYFHLEAKRPLPKYGTPTF